MNNYSKEFKNAHKIALDGDLDYGFNNKDIKGNIGIEYTFLPLKFGEMDIYKFVNFHKSIF